MSTANLIGIFGTWLLITLPAMAWAGPQLLKPTSEIPWWLRRATWLVVHIYPYSRIYRTSSVLNERERALAAWSVQWETRKAREKIFVEQVRDQIDARHGGILWRLHSDGQIWAACWCGWASVVVSSEREMAAAGEAWELHLQREWRQRLG